MSGRLSRRREHGGVEVDAARRRGPKVIGLLGKHGRDRRCSRQPVDSGLWLVHRLHPAPFYDRALGSSAAHRVLRGAQSRDACAAVASSRKQLRVVHVVVGRSSRLNSRLNSPTGVGSMNVDKPALSTEGGGTAHIRGAEGTIIVLSCGRSPRPREVVTNIPFGTVEVSAPSISLAEICTRVVTPLNIFGTEARVVVP